MSDLIERLRGHFAGAPKGLRSSTFDILEEAADRIAELDAEQQHSLSVVAESYRRAEKAETALSQARAEGRREGMEEAARLVENQGAELHMREDEGIDRFDAAMILAANIRALSQKEAGKDEGGDA
ncbi:hypothetical protein [Aurantimonas coralicida]|uniref:hypothetical protein n=1 Tax=Aurantimonas coralicida TaxID=182270 RepID=UPI001E42F3AC|nr:hypothetical protein [Aurantimonas coralicida]MCD1645221.1 hypothetical protein [Aurantimonas coralicida]